MPLYLENYDGVLVALLKLHHFTEAATVFHAYILAAADAHLPVRPHVVYTLMRGLCQEGGVAQAWMLLRELWHIWPVDTPMPAYVFTPIIWYHRALGNFVWETNCPKKI